MVGVRAVDQRKVGVWRGIVDNSVVVPKLCSRSWSLTGVATTVRLHYRVFADETASAGTRLRRLISLGAKIRKGGPQKPAPRET